MGKLVLIDGNAILHRAFHAMPPLTTKNGEPINAVYGLISMFLRIVQDLKPNAIAVAFDEKKPTFRHKEFKEYQSQRPPTHMDLISQFSKARDFFAAAKVPVYSKQGYEADDVLGTIAEKVNGEWQEIKETIIVTGDRDLLQLVDDKKGIALYMPITGLSNAKLYKETDAKERMGIIPTLIPDYKALAGDPSDNYPGVAGIGPKTAIKLLDRYNSVSNIYVHLQDIEPKVRQKLEAKKDDAKLFHRLATVVLNVPIKIDFPQMEKWQIDSTEVIKLFEDFGFKTLTSRIKKVGEDIQLENQGSLF